MIRTPWILVQKRDEGRIAVGNNGGGYIYPPMRTLERLAEPPDEIWFDYLLEKFGEGRYLVTTQGAGGHLVTLFSGAVEAEECFDD